MKRNANKTKKVKRRYAGLTAMKIFKPEGNKGKIVFKPEDVNDGKIALDLWANDIAQLLRDLSSLGITVLGTWDDMASVCVDASQIPVLEQLSSLKYGQTLIRGVT